MMSSVQRKIEDRSGASLSVALLFFLVCAIVGSILIAAASVSMGRMKGIDDGEQERYSLDSAMDLIAEEMQGGELTLTASMGAPIQVRDNSTDDEETNDDSSEDDEDGDDEDNNGYISSVLDDFAPWKLSQISFQYGTKNPEPSGGLVKLRNDSAKAIFTHFMNTQSVDILSEGGPHDVNGSVLGIWYPSENDLHKLVEKLSEEDADDDDDLIRFFFSSPGNNSVWKNLDGNSYRYITAHGTELTEDPIILSLGADDRYKVCALFSMDAQFNISTVIYPYSDGKKLQDANMYRVVMIPCPNQPNITFSPGIQPDDISVQHSVTLNIKWGKAKRYSVIPDETTTDEKYFPEQFKTLLIGSSVSETS